MENNIAKIAQKLDSLHFGLQQARNLHVVYLEAMEREVKALEDAPALVPLFVRRFDLIRSLADVAIVNIDDKLNELEAQVKAAYQVAGAKEAL